MLDIRAIVSLCDAQLTIAAPKPPRKRARNGGKAPGKKLRNPVKTNSDRAAFIRYFIGKNRKIEDAQKHFRKTRQNIVAHWYAINKAHGLGYRIDGGVLRPVLPEGAAVAQIFERY